MVKGTLIVNGARTPNSARKPNGARWTEWRTRGLSYMYIRVNRGVSYTIKAIKPLIFQYPINNMYPCSILTKYSTPLYECPTPCTS